MKRVTKFGLVLIGGSLLLNTLTLSAALAAPETYYLTADGVPVASLSSTSLPDIMLPDYDPWRDGNSGILIERGGSGSAETDSAKYQQWDVDVSGATLSVTNMTIWAAEKDMAGASYVEFTAYLLRCSVSCVVVNFRTSALNKTSAWKKVTIPLSAGSYTYATGERLVVKIVVPGSSDDDMLFAYGTQTYDAGLKLSVSTPPTTTTTSTISSTTTTTPGPTTTSLVSTTTSAPGGSSTTTSATGGGSTTTLDAGATTTLAATNTTTEQSGNEPAAGTSTTLASSPDATPLILGDPGTEMIVEASGAGVADDLFSVDRQLFPQQGLTVTFLSAAEAFRSQFLASTGLGLVGALLVVFGMRRKGDDEQD